MFSQLVLVAAVIFQVETQLVLNIVYYEMPPFIYRDKNGILQGMIPDIATKLPEFCDIKFNYVLDTTNATNFRAILNRPDGFNQYLSGDFIWMSLLEKIPKDIQMKLRLVEYALFESTGFEVIVSRKQVAFLAKVVIGLYECRYLLTLALILTIIFGTLIWFIERWKNPEFCRRFKGFGTGIWLCVVTMTTVGYGDVAPRSSTGRFVSIMWMIIGIFISAVLVSTMTDVFSGNAHYGIYKEHVVAKSNSAEAMIAEKEYKSTVTVSPDYLSLFDEVASVKYKAGIINSDVLGFYQEYIHGMQPEPLQVVEKVMSNIPVSILYTATNATAIYKFYKCLGNTKTHYDAVEVSVEGHRGYIQRSTIALDESVLSFLFNNAGLMALSITALAFLCIGMIYEAILHLQGYTKRKSFSLGKIEEGRDNLGIQEIQLRHTNQDLERLEVKIDQMRMALDKMIVTLEKN